MPTRFSLLEIWDTSNSKLKYEIKERFNMKKEWL